MDLQDELRVRELVERYTLALNEGDLGGYVSTFTSDGCLTVESGNRQYVGRTEIGEFFKGYLSRSGTGMVHFNSSPLVRSDGNKAYMMTNALVFTADDHGIVTRLIAKYFDTCVKVDGEWLFQERRVRIVLSGALQQL